MLREHVILLALLAAIYWGWQFLHLMALRPEAFRGPSDKAIWAAGFLLLPFLVVPAFQLWRRGFGIPAPEELREQGWELRPKVGSFLLILGLVEALWHPGGIPLLDRFLSPTILVGLAFLIPEAPPRSWARLGRGILRGIACLQVTSQVIQNLHP